MAEAPQNSFLVEYRDEWRSWLQVNFSRNEGVWVISWKKATNKPQVPYEELIEEAICFGWIDGKPNTLDSERSMRWFAPRRIGANWSKLNKERAARAIASGLMTPVGLAKIEAAQVDGTWNALDEVELLTIPKDLSFAFDAYEFARQNFEGFPRSVKRSILEWINSAKTDSTREKRIFETARLAAVDQRANQWRK